MNSSTCDTFVLVRRHVFKHLAKKKKKKSQLRANMADIHLIGHKCNFPFTCSFKYKSSFKNFLSVSSSIYNL